MNQLQLQSTLDTATATLAAQQSVVTECKTRHREATESHQRSQQAIDQNVDESEDLIVRLMSDAAKCRARVNQERRKLDDATAPLAELQAAVTRAQAALDAHVHALAAAKFEHHIAEVTDRLRCMVTDITGLLDALRKSAVESAAAQGISPARTDHLWLLRVCHALEGLDLATLRAVTNVKPLSELAFGVYSETPLTGRNEHASHPTECVELALSGQNPAKIFTERAAQKLATADEHWLTNNAHRIAELDAKIGAEVAELPTADRIEVMTYRVLRRLQSGEPLTPTEREWSRAPELKGLRADHHIASSWYSDDAVTMDKLIEWRSQTAREALARKAS